MAIIIHCSERVMVKESTKMMINKLRGFVKLFIFCHSFDLKIIVKNFLGVRGIT